MKLVCLILFLVCLATSVPNVDGDDFAALEEEGKRVVDKGGSGCNRKKCGMCQGDCDKDSQCKGNLKCFQRTKSSDKVPGCANSGYKKKHDYCYNPDLFVKKRVVDKGGSGCNRKKCGECEGDCDKDSHCKAGLKCYQRTRNSDVVPGCANKGYKRKHDYCYNPNPPLAKPATPDPCTWGHGSRRCGGCLKLGCKWSKSLDICYRRDFRPSKRQSFAYSQHECPVNCVWGDWVPDPSTCCGNYRKKYITFRRVKTTRERNGGTCYGSSTRCSGRGRDGYCDAWKGRSPTPRPASATPAKCYHAEDKGYYCPHGTYTCTYRGKSAKACKGTGNQRNQKRCPAGHYCLDGVKKRCPRCNKSPYRHCTSTTPGRCDPCPRGQEYKYQFHKCGTIGL